MSKRRTERLGIALLPEEKAMLQHLASQEKRTMPDIVRRLIWDAAQGNAPAHALTVRTEGNFGQMAHLPG